MVTSSWMHLACKLNTDSPLVCCRTPVQNVLIPLLFPNECHQGLWGGEGIIKGFQKRHPRRRRVPHYWFPNLHRTVIYSEILNKHMTTVVTQRALNLIHENYGLDHYILKVSFNYACVAACSSVKLRDLRLLWFCRRWLLLLHRRLPGSWFLWKVGNFQTERHFSLRRP